MRSNEPRISGSTQVYALIGDPIDHSLSPTIQNVAFACTGLNAVYVAFPVRDGALRPAVRGLRNLRVRGFNVTTPHKNAVMRYLDRVDTEAAEVGSINTVTNDRETLTGFNTDGTGAMNAIKEVGASVDGSTVLLLGAGGAARSIAYALANRGCSIKLANRTASVAKRFSKALDAKFGVKTESMSLSKKLLSQAVTQADLILNASSMGMNSESDPPIAEKWIRADQWVFDIVYRPVQTKLLRDAKSAGARTIGGVDMLLHQGGCSFKLWTGKKAPLREMRRAIAEKLMLQNATRR